jgi:hypothetical protein
LYEICQPLVPSFVFFPIIPAVFGILVAYIQNSTVKSPVPKSNAASPATPNAATVNIKSNAEYDALPSGTIFVDPNGQQRRKP